MTGDYDNIEGGDQSGHDRYEGDGNGSCNGGGASGGDSDNNDEGCKCGDKCNGSNGGEDDNNSGGKGEG